MNHTKTVVDSLDFDLQVAESPLIARDLWEGAEFVLVGSDLAGKCVENLVPRRFHLLVVHGRSEAELGVAPESISERDIWRHAVALGAEYAVGTVAVAGLGGVLLKLLTRDSVRDLLWSIISNAFARFFG